MPGLIDAHVHVYAAGLRVGCISRSPITCLAHFAARVSTRQFVLGGLLGSYLLMGLAVAFQPPDKPLLRRDSDPATESLERVLLQTGAIAPAISRCRSPSGAERGDAEERQHRGRTRGVTEISLFHLGTFTEHDQSPHKPTNAMWA
jgi:hypothetical protein